MPRDRRRCVRHGLAILPAEDPFPLEGEERRLAELDTWHAAMPTYNVPISYADVSFESRRPTPALEGARAAYERHECQGVMLEGSVGCGKTTALRALLRARVIEDAETGGGEDIRWFDFTHLSRLLLDRDQQRRTMDAALECDLLLCDDLGAGHVKRGGFVTSVIEEIVLHREQHRYPFVAATNLEPRAFRALFGERTYDRWRGAWGVWLNVSGASLRRKQRRPSR